jgi:polar amino acid transport system permease protein
LSCVALPHGHPRHAAIDPSLHPLLWPRKPVRPGPIVRHSFAWPFLREGYWDAFAALTLSFSADADEILRGGVKSVPRSEIEAAKSLGLQGWTILLLIIIPGAFRISFPTFGGQNIILLKSIVLVSTITVMDLLGTANYIRIQTRVY